MKAAFRKLLIWALKRSYEKQIKSDFDYNLSKKLDCCEVLSDMENISNE